jgi:hypothetical protein
MVQRLQSANDRLLGGEGGAVGFGKEPAFLALRLVVGWWGAPAPRVLVAMIRRAKSHPRIYRPEWRRSPLQNRNAPMVARIKGMMNRLQPHELCTENAFHRQRSKIFRRSDYIGSNL